MTNILSLQRTLLGSAITDAHNTESADYVSFGSDPDELKTMAEVSNHVYAFGEKPFADRFKDLTNVTFYDSAKDFKDLKPVVVRIDAHVNGKQDQTECKVLIGFTKMLAEHKPFVFVRNEDPEITNILIGVFDKRGYDCFFFPETDTDGVRITKIWMLGIHREFTKTMNLSWELAKDTGHPAGDSPFRLVIH